MNTHHIDPLVLDHYRKYRASNYKPADAWLFAMQFASYTRALEASHAR